MIKFETPFGQRNILDIHPSRSHRLQEPYEGALITEGTVKGDSAASIGLSCIAMEQREREVWTWAMEKVVYLMAVRVHTDHQAKCPFARGRACTCQEVVITLEVRE